MTSDGSTHFSYLLFCALGAITAWTCSLQCWTPVKAGSEVVQRASLPDTASFLFPYGSRQPSILVLVCLIMLFKRRFGKSVNRRNQIGNGTTHTQKHTYIDICNICPIHNNTMIEYDWMLINLWSSGRDCDSKTSCIKISECVRCDPDWPVPTCPDLSCMSNKAPSNKRPRINLDGLQYRWQFSWCILPSKRTRPRLLKAVCILQVLS
jgi:hypothetical protein